MLRKMTSLISVVTFLIVTASCTAYKADLYKDIQGVVMKVTSRYDVYDITLDNGKTYYCSYGKVKPGDSIRITYFFDRRNQRDHVSKIYMSTAEEKAMN